MSIALAQPDPGDPNPPEAPTRCLLRHRMFTVCGTPLFRRAETDGAPVMVVQMGEREAALPLRSLQREFGIGDDTPDGRMLALIAEALDFVTALHLGDTLPSEVLTGKASWEPNPTHVAIVNARLRLQMVAWLTTGTGGERIEVTAESLLQVADDQALRARVQTALDHAAQELGLRHADQVLKMLEALGEELSYIEALRERLLGRLTATVAKIERVAGAWRGDAHQSETSTQVRRLAHTALQQTRQRFDELDAQTGEVLAALRNADSQRSFIRAHRDWLYRSLRAWEPVLGWWEAAGSEFDPAMTALMGRTYQFLAPRFMAVTEWLSVTRPGRTKSNPARMIW
jgi:hypothetical protein